MTIQQPWQVAQIVKFVEFTCLCNVALSMAESPDNGVNDKLELIRRHGEEGSKAVVGDGSQQAEELQPVLWELLHIKAQ